MRAGRFRVRENNNINYNMLLSSCTGQRMLYEKIPNGPFKEVMSGYVECLMQEDKLHLIKFLADGTEINSKSDP